MAERKLMKLRTAVYNDDNDDDNINEKSGYLRYTCNTLHSCDVLKNAFDVLGTQDEEQFPWCRIPASYKFISFIFHLPALIYRQTFPLYCSLLWEACRVA
jgi:hypothetical protein